MDDDNRVLSKYHNGLGIDNKLKLTSNGVSKYFLQDHLGSTIGLTDSSGTVSSSASYDSFGNSTNNLTTRYQFTGREFDSFTGLQYSRARWYDANLGRFISEDPIGFAGGDVNLFGYVRNNPVSRIDPSGLQDTDIVILNSPPFTNPPTIGCSCNRSNPDVSAIMDGFDNSVKGMNERGNRYSQPQLNNIGASLQYLNPFYWLGYTEPIKGCGQQKEQLINDLLPTFAKTRSVWTPESRGPTIGFQEDGEGHLLPHQWAVFTSSNPQDPKILVDPWSNKIKCECGK